MPTTPKASTARRDFSFGDAVKGGLAKVPAQPAVGSVSMDESEDHDLDGRSTPVPGSNSSSSRTNTSSSPPSTAPPLTPSDPNTSTSLLAMPDTARPFPSAPIGLVIPQAIHGFGQLAGEEQLKVALQNKDRIFVVMVANEIEAFIARILAGDKPVEAQQLPHAVYTQTNLGILSNSVKMHTVSTSKFQRMLMYRAAEWYGVKCVTGPEGVMYVGTLGEMAAKSGKLKLPMLVPEREKQQQKFQIMQRRPASSANGVAANGNGGTGNNGEAGPTSRKTLEQREAEYAQARERIFQSQTQSQSHGQNEDKAIPAESSDRNRGRQGEEDDLGPTASRFPVQRSFEPVYASLYHPPADTATTAASMGQPYDPNRGMMHQAYYSADGQYITYPQLPHGGQYADPYAMGGLHMPIPTMSMPIPPNTHSQHQPYTPAQGYDMNGQPIMLVSNGMGGYVPWGPQVQIPPAQAVPGVGGVPPPSIGIGMPLHQQRQQWAYGNPPMPLVPNGQTPYAGRSNGSNLPPPPASISSHSAFSSPTSASSFGGYSGAGSVAGPSSRQGSGTFGPVSGVGPQGQNIQPGGLGLHQHLQHPKPQRPQPTHQHSYASSSISSSSRSYQQDYPHSRPHSRGSTTSTRSAASSVRLGAMYPANAGPGYGHGHGHGHGQYGGSAYGTSQIQQQLQQPQQQQQQGGSRGKHMVREVNGLTSLNIGRERRGRGQSPSGSTTTTSSRSSRRTNAHAAHAAATAQAYHPLPQRPDWVAGTSAAPSVSGSSVGAPAIIDTSVPVSFEGPSPDQMLPTSPSVGSTIPSSSPAQSDLASAVPSVSEIPDIASDAGGDAEPRGAADNDGLRVEQTPHEIVAALSTTPVIPNIKVDALVSVASNVATPEDPDFPARAPAVGVKTLYNPKPTPIGKAPTPVPPLRSVSAAPSNGSANGHARHTAGMPLLGQSATSVSVDETGMTPEDLIEAKLRAISVTTGVNIGPKPARAISASYAKAVRRD